MKQEQPFCPEYMTKKWPRPPRFFCRTLADWILGIQSPSAVFHYRLYCTDKQAEQIRDYDRKRREYQCWMRTLNKRGWKSLYRDYRKRKGKDHGPEGD